MVKKESPTERIEDVKNAKSEQIFMKYAGEGLFDSSLLRFPKHTIGNMSKMRKYLREHNRRPFTSLHTHPVLAGTAMPSAEDIQWFMNEKYEKTQIIAQQDQETKKVHGYTILKKTKNTKRPEKSKLDTPFLKFLISDRNNYLAIDDNNKNLSQYRQKGFIFGEQKEALGRIAEEYGLKYKFVPAKGFKFDKNLMSFIPQKGKTLEEKFGEKLNPLISSVSLLLGLIFLSPSITGNAIANLTTKTTSIIGAGLFIVGIVGSYFYFRKK